MTYAIGKLILRNLDVLAREAVRQQYQEEKHIWSKYGSQGRARALEDARYNLRFLAEALQNEEPVLFSEYAAWLKVLFKGLGFPDSVITSTINYTFKAVRRKISETDESLLQPYIDSSLEAVQSPAGTSSFIEKGDVLRGLSRKYLDLLLKRDRKGALSLILDAVESGTSIVDIYLKVFQPVQREVGRLWQNGMLGVAEEHYCTAATQVIMSQLYPKIFATPGNGCRLLSASVSEELHEMGIRMVTDLFTLDGWDAYYLGSNTPGKSIVEVASEWSPDVVAISVTMTFHVNKAAEIIKKLRQAGNGKTFGILVGGLPFNIAPGLWKKLGADGYAGDGRQAVIIARQLAEGCGQ